MDMRMKVELLAPGVQYGEETDLCTEVPRITTNFEKSLRTGAEQEIVNDLLVLQHQRCQPTWQCEDHMQLARDESVSLILNPYAAARAIPPEPAARGLPTANATCSSAAAAHEQLLPSPELT